MKNTVAQYLEVEWDRLNNSREHLQISWMAFWSINQKQLMTISITMRKKLSKNLMTMKKKAIIYKIARDHITFNYLLKTIILSKLKISLNMNKVNYRLIRVIRYRVHWLSRDRAMIQALMNSLKEIPKRDIL